MLPEIKTEVPGPKSRASANELRQVESRNLTFVSDGFPVFWERAQGANVWDVDGNRFLDLNGGFGVATSGYGAPHLVETFQNQAPHLYHGMGDVHPSRLKVELCRELSRITFERWGAGPGKSILGCAGFEAVEAALKTARITTGKPGVLAFHSAYHGLGYGALNVTGMESFRQPFLDQLKPFVHRVDFPDTGEAGFVPAGGSFPGQDHFLQKLDAAWAPDIGAILIEPIQGRGGERFPAPWLLPLLRELADTRGALLIFDEIYSGFFRAGKWFSCEHWETVPDLVCLGKALSGSYPISACVGKAAIMDAWPESTGEALHTSTFLGNPMGCALALSSIRSWEAYTSRHPDLSDPLGCGPVLEPLLMFPQVKSVRGVGFLWAIEWVNPGGAVDLLEPALSQGLILLPAGETGKVLSVKPSVAHTSEEITFAANVLANLISR